MPRRIRVQTHRRRTRKGFVKVNRHERSLDLPNKKDRDSPYKYTVHATITIPSTIDKTKPIPESAFLKRIEEARNKAISLFDGYTSVSGTGGYFSKDLNKKIEEKVAIVHVYTTEEEWKKKDLKLRNWLFKKKREWGQETINYTYLDSKNRFRSFIV